LNGNTRFKLNIGYKVYIAVKLNTD